MVSVGSQVGLKLELELKLKLAWFDSQLPGIRMHRFCITWALIFRSLVRLRSHQLIINVNSVNDLPCIDSNSDN